MARPVLLALAAAAAAASSASLSSPATDPTPPLFGPVMTAPFNQTITIFGFRFDNDVAFYYDSTTQPVGSSLSEHGQGQHDELCTGVAGKGLSEEPCSLLDSSDSWLYLIFPASKLCCRACNTTAFCGIIAPWWLQENATYQGTTTIRGVECDGWMKLGGEQNFYYTTVASRANANARQPCQYDEGYPTFAQGSNYWNFTYSAYSVKPIPSSVFDVPADMGCDSPCKFSSDTYAERLEKRFAAGSTTLRRA